MQLPRAPLSSRLPLSKAVPLPSVYVTTDRPQSPTGGEHARSVVESASEETWSRALQAIETAAAAQLQRYATTLGDDTQSLQVPLKMHAGMRCFLARIVPCWCVKAGALLSSWCPYAFLCQGAVDMNPWTQSCLRVLMEEKEALHAALARLAHMQGGLNVKS